MKEKGISEDFDSIIVDSFNYEIIPFIKKPGTFDVIIKINGKTQLELFGFDLLFDFREFHASSKENAQKKQEFDTRRIKPDMRERFFLFTCTCGAPDCSDIYKGVLIRREGDKISWLVDEKVEKPKKLIFNAKNYLDLDQKLYENLKELAKNEPGLIYGGTQKTLAEIISQL